MPLFGDAFDGMLKKVSGPAHTPARNPRPPAACISHFRPSARQAAASAKVLAKDAVKGGSKMVQKVAAADMQGTARRLANKVAERAEGGGLALVEELPEVEAAMVNLKQTETAYRELLAVLREAFVAQGRSVTRQLRVANRAEVIGRDIEGETVRSLRCPPPATPPSQPHPMPRSTDLASRVPVLLPRARALPPSRPPGVCPERPV